jgi:hypothetical protein
MKTMTTPPEILTFALHLSTCSCTAKIDISRIRKHPPEKIFSALLNCQWQGQPTAKDAAAYLAWYADNWQTISNATNKACALLLMLPDFNLASIECEPDQKPKTRIL